MLAYMCINYRLRSVSFTKAHVIFTIKVMNSSMQRGAVNSLLVTSIVLSLFVVGLLVFGVWAFVNYQDYKNNVDSKVDAAVTVAKQAQSETDEKAFTEREKLPTRQLVGPTALGKVTFDCP